MRRIAVVVLSTLVATGVASIAAAQTPARMSPLEAAAPESGDQSSPGADGSGTGRLLRDVAGDYKHFFSIDTAVWLGVGGAAALAVHPADNALRDDTQGPTGPDTNLGGGAQYGEFYTQVPLALVWWMIGHAADSESGAATGRDLLRAQISAASWTYLAKYSVNRTRPNGDPRSFPSGHASATFATAIVVEEHYGWKLGLPFFAAAAYTGISRIADNKHWASDVVFGAFLGVASGRTVTVRLRGKKVAVSPWAVPGGAGIVLLAGE